MIGLHDPYIQTGARLRFKYHAGQRRAMASNKRFVLLLAGTQSGKTVFAPWWLLREIRKKGPGDYLFATPTFTLLELKALVEFKRLFITRLQLGAYIGSPSRVFTLSARGQEVLFGRAGEEMTTRVLFGHAQDPESLESATIKAAVLDEAGQKKFKRGSWEAIQRRLSIYEGRVLLPTTPYTLGWLKSELHDPGLAGHKDIDVIQFESTTNPAFPKSEFERMREILPAWRFRMMYQGIFERPAGMIYDCFSEALKVPRFTIPDDWPRFVGVDFGGANTAAVFIAEDPKTKDLFLYRDYLAGGLTAEGHADKMRSGEPGKLTAFGGATSEGQWRTEFSAGGLHINRPPVSEVEVGINRTYGLFKSERLFVFDDLAGFIDEAESYGRALDENGEPTEKIEDKSSYHRLDALRYIASHLNRNYKSPAGSAFKGNIT